MPPNAGKPIFSPSFTTYDSLLFDLETLFFYSVQSLHWCLILKRLVTESVCLFPSTALLHCPSELTDISQSSQSCSPFNPRLLMETTPVTVFLKFFIDLGTMTGLVSEIDLLCDILTSCIYCLLCKVADFEPC